MADTGWLSGATSGEDQSDGSVSWSFADYSELLSEDGVTCGSGGDGGGQTLIAQLIIGGALSGLQGGFALAEGALAYSSDGGPTSKWGLTPTRTQVVASTFGIGLQIVQSSAYYFGTVTNFSASIPVGATIDGIEARAKCNKTDLGDGLWDVQVDHVQVKIYYTEAASGTRPKSLTLYQSVNRASTY